MNKLLLVSLWSSSIHFWWFDHNFHDTIFVPYACLGTNMSCVYCYCRFGFCCRLHIVEIMSHWFFLLHRTCVIILLSFGSFQCIRRPLTTEISRKFVLNCIVENTIVRIMKILLISLVHCFIYTFCVHKWSMRLWNNSK